MTELHQPNSVSRRRFRFGLRTLLLLVAACAVVTWFYLTGWPWLVANWQQVQFERDMRYLRVGVTVLDLNEETFPFPRDKSSGELSPLYDINNDSVFVARYVLTNGTYFVYFTYPKGTQLGDYKARCDSVEVFRLPSAPPDYRARRKVYDNPLANSVRPPEPSESPDDAYVNDFFQFVTGDRKDDFGLKPKLIYSDPPAKPEAK